MKHLLSRYFLDKTYFNIWQSQENKQALKRISEDAANKKAFDDLCAEYKKFNLPFEKAVPDEIFAQYEKRSHLNWQSSLMSFFQTYRLQMATALLSLSMLIFLVPQIFNHFTPSSTSLDPNYSATKGSPQVLIHAFRSNEWQQMSSQKAFYPNEELNLFIQPVDYKYMSGFSKTISGEVTPIVFTEDSFLPISGTKQIKIKLDEYIGREKFYFIFSKQDHSIAEIRSLLEKEELSRPTLKIQEFPIIKTKY